MILNARFQDAAIVKAVSVKKEKVFTLEELERDLTSRAPPRRTTSPILGSPPPSGNLPIGTPPRHHFMQKAAAPPSGMAQVGIATLVDGLG